VRRKTFYDVGKIELDASLVGDRRQVKGAVGRPARGGDDGGRILQGLSRDDVARPDVARDQVHHRSPAGGGDGAAPGVDSGNEAGAGQRDADRFRHRRHRARGVLPRAGADRRAGRHFQALQLVAADLAAGVGAHAFEHLDDADLTAVEIARQQGAAIQEHRWHVEPHHRHHHAGQGLVAARQANDGIVAMAAHDQLDRLRHQLARHQRSLHAAMAVGDAVGHAGRGELEGGAAGLAHARLHELGLVVQRHVAGRGFAPGRGDADQRLIEIIGREPGAEHHGAHRRLLGSFGHITAGQATLVEAWHG
jgi:hypothetical protein